jgi:hypothetical protein
VPDLNFESALQIPGTFPIPRDNSCDGRHKNCRALFCPLRWGAFSVLVLHLADPIQ